MTECFYCGRPLYAKSELRIGGSIIDKLIPISGILRSSDKPMLTQDHVIPRSRVKGAANNIIVLACQECNVTKANLTLEEYRVVIAFRYGYINGVNWLFPGEQINWKSQDAD